MSVTWIKLRDGSWGLRSDAVLVEGDMVWAVSKDGRRSKVTVGPHVWGDLSCILYRKGVSAPKAAPVVDAEIAGEQSANNGADPKGVPRCPYCYDETCGGWCG